MLWTASSFFASLAKGVTVWAWTILGFSQDYCKSTSSDRYALHRSRKPCCRSHRRLAAIGGTFADVLAAVRRIAAMVLAARDLSEKGSSPSLSNAILLRLVPLV